MADDLYTARYREALDRAAYWHGDQIRKGSGVPYISHLLTVSALAWEDGGSETEAIAALLHDAVEDGKAPLAEVRARFGDDVANIVDDCSDSAPDPGEQKAPWFERKASHVIHLRGLASQPDSDSTMRVVGADKLANVRTILVASRGTVPDLWDRFKGGLGGGVWYYSEMADLVGRRLPGSMLARELGLVVDDLEGLMDEVVAESVDAFGATIRHIAAALGNTATYGDVDATTYLAFELARAVAPRANGPSPAAVRSVFRRWFRRPDSGESADADLGDLEVVCTRVLAAFGS